MANSTEVFWDIDGVSLQTYAYNIETWGGDRQSVPSLRGNDITIPYAAGSFWVPKIPDSRSISIAGWVVGATEDGDIPLDSNKREVFEANWNMLKRLMWTPHRQVKLTKRWKEYGSDEVLEATALAQFTGGLSPTMTGTSRATFVVQLQLADPFFYGAEEETIVNSFQIEGVNYANNPSPQKTSSGWASDVNQGDGTLLTARLDGMGEEEDYGTYLYPFVSSTTPVGGISYGRSFFNDISINENGTYSYQASVKATEDTVVHPWIEFYDDNSTIIGTRSVGADVSITGETWTHVRMEDIEPPALTYTAKVGVSISPTGHVLGEPVTNWFTNPTFATTTGAKVTLRTNMSRRPTPREENLGAYWSPGNYWSLSYPNSNYGRFRALFTISGNIDVGGNDTTSASMALLNSNSTYVMSLEVRPSKDYPIYVRALFNDASNATIGSLSGTPVMCKKGIWTRIYVVATSPSSGVVQGGPRIRLDTPATENSYIDVRNCLIEERNSVQPFFDGNTASSGGFTYEWSGSPTMSTSLQRAPQAARVSSGPGISLWSAGDRLNLYRTGTAEQAAAGARLRSFNSLDVGKVFTVVAKCIVPEGIGTDDFASANYRSRSIYLQGDALTTYAQAPNVPGTYTLRLEITPTSAGQQVNLGGGGMVNDYVSWTDVTLVESAYDGPPFNGSSPRAFWVGVVNDSMSKFYYDVLAVDRVMVSESTYTGEYFDGNTGTSIPNYLAYWKGTPYASHSEIGTFGNSGINVVGDALTTKIVAETIDHLKNFTLTNTTTNPVSSMTVETEVDWSDSLTIDAQNFEAQKNGVRINGAITSSGSVHWIILYPGENTFRLDTEEGTGSIKLKYQPAYL